jgi:hypothetical protein
MPLEVGHSDGFKLAQKRLTTPDSSTTWTMQDNAELTAPQFG